MNRDEGDKRDISKTKAFWHEDNAWEIWDIRINVLCPGFLSLSSPSSL
jgi:hypothetical protein